MTEPVLAEERAMHARRHPILVTVAWAWFAIQGYVLAAPFHGVARHAYGHHPRADAVLFAPGAYDLLELVTMGEAGLSSAVTSATWLLVFTTVAGQLTLAMAMTQIAFRQEGRRWVPVPKLAARAIRVFLRFLGVGAASLVAKGAIVALGIWLGSLLAQNRAAAWGHARADQAGIAVAVVFVITACALHVVEEIARATIITRDVRFGRSLASAFATMKARRGAPLVAWSWRALAGIALVLLVSVVTQALPDGAGGIVLALCLHQVAVALRVGLRASWLGAALRLSVR